MPLSLPNLIYTSGHAMDSAIAIGPPVLSAPFPSVNINYILKQLYQQSIDHYSPLPLDDAYDDPTYGDFILVNESEPQPLTGGRQQWTRTYAKVPASWEDATSISFTFPGIDAVTGGVGLRAPQTKTVVARVVHDYFLCSAGQTYPTPQEIPVIEMFQPYLTSYGVQSFINSLREAAALDGPTTPTATDYLASVAAADEIVAKDSDIREWMGNIYCRESYYIKAQ